MISSLLTIFRRSSRANAADSPAPAALNQQPAPQLVVLPGDPRYPAPVRLVSPLETALGELVPTNFGHTHLVRRMAPLELVATEQDAINKTWYAAGLNIEEYNLTMRDVYVRFAEFAQLLPASESDHHCGHGGLFRHSVDVAFWATRYAEGKVYAMDREPKIRKLLEPRWRIATAIAGLLHDVGKAIVDIKVTSPDGAKRWSGFARPLVEWLDSEQLTYYRYEWQRGRRPFDHVQYATAAVHYILGPAFLEFLGQDNDEEIPRAMMAAIQGVADEHNPIIDCVKWADKQSCMIDLARMHDEMSTAGRSGERSLAPSIVRVWRQAIERGDWVFNHKGPAHYTKVGVMLAYPQAITYAVGMLQQEGQIKGGREPKDVIRSLENCGALMPSPVEGGEDSILVTAMPISGSVNVMGKFVLLADADKVFAGLHFPSPSDVQFEAAAPSPPSADANASPGGTEKVTRARKGAAAAAKPATKTDDQLDMFTATTKVSAAQAAADTPSSPSSIDNPEETDDAIEVVDRRERTSQASERRRSLQEAQKDAAAPFPKTPEEARAWLDEKGMAGAALLAVMARVGKKALWEKNLDIIDGHLVMRYPDLVKDIVGHEPVEIMEAFKAEGWLDPNPEVPERMTHRLTIGDTDGMALQLTETATLIFTLLVPKGAILQKVEVAEETTSRRTKSGNASRRGETAASPPSPQQRLTSDVLEEVEEEMHDPSLDAHAIPEPEPEPAPEPESTSNQRADTSTAPAATSLTKDGPAPPAAPKTKTPSPLKGRAREIKQKVWAAALEEFGGHAAAPTGDALHRWLRTVVDVGLPYDDVARVLAAKPNPVLIGDMKIIANDPDAMINQGFDPA